MKKSDAKRLKFEKTNVGVIPSDWKCIRLGDVFEERKANGRPGLKTYSVTVNKGLVPRDTLERKMAPDLPAEASLLVEVNDIAYNMMRMWQGAVALASTSCVVSPAYVVCRPTGPVSPLFMLYYFKSHIGLYQLWAYSHGITADRLRLYFDDFAKVPAPLPPFQEQVKIAEILSVCDSAIERLSELIAAKREQQNCLMRQLLFCGSSNTPRVRVRGFSRAWKHCFFGDVFERVVRKNTVGCENVLTISGARGLISQREYYSKRIAAEDHSGYYLLQHGEFAYNKSYSQGYPLGAIKRLNRYEDGVVSTLYICFRIQGNATDSDFAQHYFDSGVFNRELYMIAQEGARNHGLLNVTPDDFFASRLLLPPLDEQKSISEILNAAEAEIDLLEQKQGAMQQQKKGLMQKLLTGQIRVKP